MDRSVEESKYTADDETFRRALSVVLKRYESTFKALADFDRGIPLPRNDVEESNG